MPNKSEAIEKRVLRHARLFIKRGATIRSVAAETKWSKSTVDLDLRRRLPELHFELYERVVEKLQYHKTVRHVRGGESTKLRWEKKKNNEEE